MAGAADGCAPANDAQQHAQHAGSKDPQQPRQLPEPDGQKEHDPAVPATRQGSSGSGIGLGRAASGGAPAAAPLRPHIPAAFAASEDKGCRQTMEDAWVAEADARRDASAGAVRVAYCGVFDGHGGRNCAAHAAAALHTAALAAGLVPPEVASGASPPDVKRVRQAVTEAFKATDAELCALCEKNGWQDGAAAVVCWLVGDLCVVANVGDAKAVLARDPPQPAAAAGGGDGEPGSSSSSGSGAPRALTLTKEHLALHASERARITAAGGFVSKDGRLNGRIQVSRSFGDAQFKKAGATAAPDMQVFTLTPRDRFMLLACDGFWGVFDPQAAVATTQQLLAEGREPKAITNRLINEAIRERRCKDNCTVLLVVFGSGGSGGGTEAKS